MPSGRLRTLVQALQAVAGLCLVNVQLRKAPEPCARLLTWKCRDLEVLGCGRSSVIVETDDFDRDAMLSKQQWLFDGMTDADVLLEGSRAKGEPAEMIKSMPEVLRLRAERGAAALEESRL